MKRSIKVILIFLIFSVWISEQVYSNDDPPFTDEKELWIDSVFSTLDLNEKIGQLFMVAAYSNRGADHKREILSLIGKYHIGGLIFFQGGPVRQARLTNEYQAASAAPLLIAMDAEWGLGMRLDSTISYPYQMALGAIPGDSLIYDMGVEIGSQFKRMGMHINFAPVVDVNNNARNPVINFRSFGENKKNVAQKGLAYMRGLQDNGVLASGKHFPGHGDTEVDSHKDLPVIDHPWDRLNEIELYPFRKLINEGLGSVMVAHLNIPVLDAEPDKPSTLSKPIVTGLLRDSLDFEGIVFTDALNMKGITKQYEPGEVDLRAFRAGNDILLFSMDVPKGIALIREAVNNGEINESEIDRRVKKVLSLKYWAGLNDYKPVEMEGLVKDLNRPESRLLKKKLIEASLTTINNKNKIIPLKRLDTLKIVTVTIGESEKDIFHDRLDDYTRMDHLMLTKDSDYFNISGRLDKYNLCILNFRGLSQYASMNFGLGDKVIDLARLITANHNTILVWHGNPYGLNKLHSVDSAVATIVTYQDGKLFRDLSAQLIFGAFGSEGKLPVTINMNYPSGTGLQTMGDIRFGYTLPEEVGLDSDYLFPKLDSMAQYTLENQVAPGMQILVARDQKVVYHRAFGYHTYDSTREVSLKDLYDFASVTKITSALPALMRLHDQQKFDLDATLADYLRYFRWGNKRKIRIRRILSHNAGLQSWIPYWQTTLRKSGKFKWGTLSTDSTARFPIKLTDNLFLFKNYKKKIYRMIRKSPVDPEQGYVYSGLAFYLWPEIIENLTGEEYEHYLKRTFYQPLGAYTLTYNPYKHFSLDQMVPTEKDTFFRKIQIHGVVHDEGAAMMDGVSANAGLFGTANDLAKLMQMYQNMGEYGGRQYISPHTVNKFTSCHYCNEGVRRGLAFDKPLLEDNHKGYVAVSTSAASFGHSGYTGTFTWADPETGILFVFMSNRVYPTRENNRISRLNIRPAMHQIVYDSRMDK